MKSSRTVRSAKRLAIASNSGFTLIEIMMVVMIIGLLAGVAASFLGDNVGVAQDTRIKADIQTISTQLMIYQAQNGHAPSSEEGLKALLEKRPRQLMKEIPTDPYGQKYEYVNPGRHNPDGFDLFSKGKDGVVGTEDDIGNWKNAR
jgi:general secretion pathway protein G